MFAAPSAVAKVGDVLYVADASGNVVRRVAATGRISTVAGDGLQRFFGDGYAGRYASLNYPTDIAHRKGYLYIADSINSRIRRLNLTTGIIHTYAGGETGFRGDGGPARLARFNQPNAVEVARDGSLLVADTGNNRIRRISPGGIVSTVAGTGRTGDAAPYGDGGRATAAALNRPEGVTAAADGGFYIADTDHHVIRRVTRNGLISTVAGDGTGDYGRDGVPATKTQLHMPGDVATTAAGELVISDSGGNRVRVVGANGVMRGLAGTYYGHYSPGPRATQAQLGFPLDVAVAPDGDVYIADSHNHLIRRLDAVTGSLWRYAGSGSDLPTGSEGNALDTALGRIDGIDVDADENVYFTESGRIRRVDKDTGDLTTVAGGGDLIGELVPAKTTRANPADVAVGPDGSVYFTEPSMHRVRRVDPTGIIVTVAGNGTAGFAGDGGPALSAQLHAPSSVAVDTAGNVLIADNVNDRIRRLSPDGQITTVAGGGTGGDGALATDARLFRPHGIAVTPDGTLFVAQPRSQRVRRIDGKTRRVHTFAGIGREGFSGEGARADGAAINPMGVAVDARGVGALYLADWTNHRIRRVQGLTLPPADRLPHMPTSIRVRGGVRSMTLSWTLPTDADLAAIEVRTLVSSPPTWNQGLVVFNARGTSVTVSGLPQGHRVYGLLSPRDKRGAYGEGAGVDAWGSVQTMRLSATTIRKGQRLQISGSLRGVEFGPLGGRTVVLQRRRRGTTSWSEVARLKTAPDGGVSRYQSPGVDTQYRWVFVGNAEVESQAGYTRAFIGSVSRIGSVDVR